MNLVLKSALALLLAATPALAGLSWEQTDVKLDAKPGEKVVTIRYPFQNSGQNPVEIRKVKASCGCTTVKLDQKVYQPGEKGEIVALFEIGKRTGTQTKRVTVTTDDKAKETLHFTVQIP